MADEDCVPYINDHGILKYVTYSLFALSLVTFVLIHVFCPPKFKRNSGYLIKKFSKNDYTACELESILKNEQHEGSTNNLISPSNEYTVMITPEEDIRFKNPVYERKDNNHLPDRNNRMTKSIIRERTSSTSHNNNTVTRGNASCDFINIGKQDIASYSASSRSFGQSSNKADTPQLKRCTSSQELLARKKENPVLNSYNSMPNVNADDISLLPLADQCTNEDNLIGSTDTDKENEGAMQCAISYTRNRYIQLSGLALQTTLPPEAPGFVVEISLVPKDMDAIRSKVYMTPPETRTVDISINETFKLNCSDCDIERCSIVITVKPLLGNIIFYAETELKSLELLLNAEVYLAGYLKGVKTYTLAYSN